MAVEGFVGPGNESGIVAVSRSEPRVGDIVKAFPLRTGDPVQTIYDPRIEGRVMLLMEYDGHPAIIVEHGGILVACEMPTATVVAPMGALSSGALPDLVAAVYANGRAEARLRGTHEVVQSGKDLTELTERLKTQFPDGFGLDIRYDPHM